MDKWPGGQNAGNHWCRIYYVKKILKKKNEESLRDLWNNFKPTNIHIIGVPEGEEREKGHEQIFEEIIVENFSITGKKSTKSRKHRES